MEVSDNFTTHRASCTGASDNQLANCPSDAKAAMSQGIRTDCLVIQDKNQQFTGSTLVPAVYGNTGQMLWRVSAGHWAEDQGIQDFHGVIF